MIEIDSLNGWLDNLHKVTAVPQQPVDVEHPVIERPHTSIPVSLGWRERKEIVNIVRLVQAIAEPIITKNNPYAKMYIAGGAVRDLVYPLKYGKDRLQPKDVDIFITGLKGDHNKITKLFNQIRTATKFGDAIHWLSNPYFAEENRFCVLSTNILDNVSIDIIQGKEDIESTVGSFDWYECCWYLHDVAGMDAYRPDLKFICDRQQIDIPEVREDVLTLLGAHHAPKTLARGFKMVERHGFNISIDQVVALATEARLAEEKYGRYIHT